MSMGSSSAAAVENSGATTVLRRFDPEKDIEALMESGLGSGGLNALDQQSELAALENLQLADSDWPQAGSDPNEEVPDNAAGGLLSKLRPTVADSANAAGEKEANGKIKARMSLFRRYAALLSALISNPGMAASGEEKGGVLRRLIVQSDKVANEFAVRLLSGLGQQSHQWVVNMAARTVSELVAERWRTNGDMNVGILLDEVARAIPSKDGLDDVATFAVPSYPSVPNMEEPDNRRAAFRVSLLKGLTPLAESMLAAKIDAPTRAKWLSAMRDATLDRMLESESLSGGYQGCSANDRVMLLQNHLGCSLGIMRSAFDHEASNSSGIVISRVISTWREVMDGLSESVDVELNSENTAQYIMSIGTRVG